MSSNNEQEDRRNDLDLAQHISVLLGLHQAADQIGAEVLALFGGLLNIANEN